MEKNIVTIQNAYGLHLRVASDIVSICRKYNARVSLGCRNCPEADGCSILELLLLNAGKGKTVTIKAEGQDAKAAVHELSNYFSLGGGI